MANKFSFDSEQLVNSNINVLKNVVLDCENDIKETKEKSRGVTKEISSVDYEILRLIRDTNDNIDFLVGFYQARLVSPEELTTYNTTFDSSDPVAAAAANPNTALAAQTYADGIGKVAWPSGLTLSISTTTSVDGYDDNGEPVSTESTNYSYTQSDRLCSIELNDQQHWDGNSFREILIGSQSEPLLVCPINDQIVRAGEISVEELSLEARGYDLDNTNTAEIKLKTVELTNNTLGVGTIATLIPTKTFLDAGINTSLTATFVYQSVTYSSDISNGSSNYNNVIKPRLDKIESNRTLINRYLDFANSSRQARDPEDFKIYITRKTLSESRKELDRLQELQDAYKSSIVGLTDRNTGQSVGNILEEIDKINRGRITLEISSQQNYSNAYLIGRKFTGETSGAKAEIVSVNSREQDETITISFLSINEKEFRLNEVINFEFKDGDKLDSQIITQAQEVVVDVDTGETKFEIQKSTINSVGISTAIVKEIQIFEGDYVTRTPGSVIITDSSGNQTVFTGITTQIINASTGSISTTNFSGVGATIYDYSFALEPEDISGISTILNIKTNHIEAYSQFSTIGSGSTPFNYIYSNNFVGFFSGSLSGDASRVRVSAATTTENIYPTFAYQANTTGISSVFLRVDPLDVFYNPNTSTFAAPRFVGQFVGGVTGSASSLSLTETTTDTNENYIIFAPSAGITSGYVNRQDLNFVPNRGEFYARKIIGIGSFSSLDVSGITTVNSLIVNNNISASGILTIGSDLNVERNLVVSGVSTFVGSVTFEGGTINLGNENTDDINVVGEFISNLTPDVTNTNDLGTVSKQWRNLYLSGISSSNSLYVTGIATIGSLTILNDISASGILTIGSDLNVSGHTQLNTLVVSGLSTFNSNVDINANASITSLNVTSTATVDELESTNINNSGILTSTSIRAQFIRSTGVSTLSTLRSTNSTIANLNVDKTNADFIKVGIITSRVSISTESYSESLVIDDYGFISNGYSEVNISTDVITIGSDSLGRHLNDGDLVTYTSDSSGVIGGLTNESSYYVTVESPNSIKLYTDSGLTSLVDLTSLAPQTGIHTFTKASGVGTIRNFDSRNATIDDLTATTINAGFITATNSYTGLGTFTKLRVEGPSNVTILNITNFIYDNNTGLSTITVDGSHGLIPSQKVRLSDIEFSCAAPHAGVTTTIFPDGTQGFEFTVSKITGITSFTTNVGVSTIAHTYVSGGTVEIGVNPRYFLPTSDGLSGQTIVTDGAGNLSFGSADRYGGNRIYVSKAFGNDINDGKTAPVRTLKKACQLASAESYEDNVTIFISSGDYEEDNPIIVPDNVSVFGDNLRRVILRPKNANKDFLRVRNGAYVNGLVFKDAVSYPLAQGAREDIIRKAGEYAKILVNGTTGTAITYRSITPVTSPVVSAGSTVSINDRIDDLIELAITSIENEKTTVPVASDGNSDAEFVDAGQLILNNIGSTLDTSGNFYIPGNSVGWGTDISGGNYTLDSVTDFEKEIYRILNGIQKDLRYGGIVGNEYVMEEIRNIIVGTPTFTFDFAIAFDDPFDTTVSREGYVGLSSTRPRITLSPYIQNCSIISFLGANGVNVDGSKIVLDNIPLVPEEAENPAIGDIPDQGKSMVANAFTMISFGGIGWKCSNAGYAQIVSCFQIFCSIGSYCQSGGYLSITNSATNFGLYALRSTGFRLRAFDFDKGVIFDNGTSGDSQTLRVGNLQRDDQELYVLKFIRASTGLDETSNFKSTGITTEVSGPAGINTTNSTLYVGAAGTEFSDGDPVIYTSPTTPIPGLINDTTYYITISGAGSTTGKLFYDDELQNRVFFTSGPAPSGIHTFYKSSEEFFAEEIIEKHQTYQDLTLTDTIGVGVTFTLGQGISQTRSDTLVAVGYAATWTSTVLTVSVELSTDITGSPSRNLFQTQGAGGGVIFDKNNTTTSITDVDSRLDLKTINFKVGSTIPGNNINGITGLPQVYKCHLHRPSIVNSSAHTWEYAGSGTDYNALPENGGQGNVLFEQLSENGGRVYTSGTNELGDFKIGDFITAFNRTGEIQFNNRVTIGQLDALELSLSSGVRITEISASQELGTDEIGGPKNERLITQLAAYSYIQNHLGDFIDASKSTAAIPNSIVQLDSQGKLNEDMIPPVIRFNSVFDVNVSGGRTDLCNDIPAIEVLKSDIVTEDTGITTTNYTLIFENESQFLVLSDNTRNYKFDNGDTITASQNQATGIVTTPTSVSYGSTGLVKGVMQSITIGVAGTGYQAAGIYTGVSLISNTGIGTDAVADITVGSDKTISIVNLRRGGRYYQSGDLLSVDVNDVGGGEVGFTTASFTVNTVHTRLYVDLTNDLTQFLASQSVPDFIADGDSVSISTNFSSVYSQSFNPTSVGVGGSVYFSENSILLPPGHDFSDGDPVRYEVTGGTVISQLINNQTYFIKTVGVSSIKLASSYDGNGIISLDSSGSGSHVLRRLGVSTATNFIIIKNHGFTTGNSVRLTGSDVPEGLVSGNYYFLGSVIQNGFTLHDVRQDALTSVNGQSFNEKNLTDSGSGIGTFKEQNVTFVDTINTSSNNPSNFSILVTSADIDASSVISGVFNPARLASSGTPNNTTFLRGDSSWSRATQQITVDSTDEEALNISVTSGKPGGVVVGAGIETYYGNLTMTVVGVTTTGIGASSYSTKGVSRFQVKNGGSSGPFGITTTGSYVTLRSTAGDTNDNGIDAKTLGGVQLSSVVNLTSTTVGAQNYTRGILQSQNGGTSSDNSGATTGETLICSGGGTFQSTQYPQFKGGVGIGYYSSLAASGVQKLVDLDQKVSLDATEVTGVQTLSATEIYSFVATTFRSGKFIIQITNNTTNEYHTTECIILHDGTDAYITEYGSIFTSSELATFDADINSGNVRLLATPTSTDNMTFKIFGNGLIRV